MIADYVIELKDKTEIPLLFNTWTFRNYSYRKGFEMEELFTQVTNGTAFRGNDLPTLLHTAAESYVKYSEGTEKYTEDDACEWMDELGRFISSPKIMEIYKLFVARLVNIDPKVLEIMVAKVEAGEVEAKTEQPKKKKVKG
jgi:hypothetical protein